MIRWLAALIAFGVAAYLALSWWSFRVTGHPDELSEPWFA